ncbi:MAG: bifunctional 4-hydroxy-2-oxoglutarate aldolase/2-dehydro-3-deoxy-phosphogluconate aldolase [Chelatococcus sp.]|nr:bifunctional 4-hydroxy-2-oxoglutarate aldolase/2-dehydro-3-deoxy-phosphogluconate aldolase [Chelatococcus sp. HY11]MBX3538964.1 bifunctional 4-hydroxy-2-oxoglutarate aldolase/2-dehydro-3-deoxy-phosphogluconate aldolase [Chelatococcus sp.]MBX3543352.1 bifunctional 4-hydroxy-2-oxoglutarate aldolase/2-dehydro-3-deoxy-phosphogluconate aldolase [Chelatococcus sp.]
MMQGYVERIRRCGVVPVVTVPDIEAAVPLTQALADGGIDVVELTLRTAAGLKAVEAVASKCPNVLVIAGTLTLPEHFAAVKNAGAAVAVSPGFNEALHHAAVAAELPWLPGVATASELMSAMALGRSLVKFFPAGLAGGVKMLKALSGPFPDATFCPTGGVDPDNLKDYLTLPQVVCVGGSWLVPLKAVTERNWGQIRTLAQEARDRVDALRGN